MFLSFERGKTVQGLAWKYQTAFPLYPARLHLPVIVYLIKKETAILHAML